MDVFSALDRLCGPSGARRIVGINPPLYDFAWFDFWAKPVGLLGLLGRLRDEGDEVSLIDCLYEGRTERTGFGRWKVLREEREKPAPYGGVPRRFYRFGIGGEELRARLAETKRPHAILVTSIMTYWYLGVFEALRAAKEVFPDVPVILGGIYAALCPGHASRSGADFVDTSSCLPGRAPLPMDLYPAPEYGVLRTSYGCPMRCGYCASRLLFPSFVQRPLGEIVEELESQLAIGTIRNLAFYDDALLIDAQKRFLPLAAHLARRHPGVVLHAPNGLHVGHLDVACCEALFSAGFRTIRLGLEGLDPSVVSSSSGKVGSNDYETAVANLQRAGYPPERIETYILVGLPGQSARDVAVSIDYVRGLGARPRLAEFSPIPGTPLFEEARRAHPEIADEPLLHNNTIYAPYVAGTIAPDDLESLKDRARH